MSRRDWVLVIGTATLTTFVVLALTGSPTSPRTTDLDEGLRTGRVSPSRVSELQPKTPEKLRVTPTPAHVPEESQKSQREKRKLRSRIQTLKSEVSELEESEFERTRYQFDLSQDDWKQLAEEGRLKYRFPCFRDPNHSWQMYEPTREKLGLSPDDGAIVMDAHRHSNERLWKTIQPLCLDIAHDESLVALLGLSGCKQLVEKAAYKNDPIGAHEERGLVAETHAGMRSPPKPDETQHPIFSLFMALTSEAQLFEEELAEHLGPDEAKRIWHSMTCASTMK